MKYADLHVHTYFSDGTFSPEKLILEAIRAGLSCISITDHDTVEALDITIEAAGSKLEILSGIELSAEYEGCEVHILGYLIDWHDKEFLSMLKSMKEIRTQRIFGICEKLKALGIHLEPSDIFRLSEHGTVGRLHVAKALQLKGYVATTSEAFARYIGDKGPAYVGKFKMTPQEAIDWILKVGGVPVLAHPYVLADISLIDRLAKSGLRGLEIFYPEHSNSRVEEYKKIAAKNGLIATGGSDCHGEAKSELGLGKVKLPYEYIEILKEEGRKIKDDGRRKREERQND